MFTPPAGAPAGGAGTAGVYEVTGNGGVGTQDEARTSLNTAAANQVGNANVIIKTTTVPYLNFGPNDGHFFDANAGGHIPNQNFLNGAGNDIAQLSRGNVIIPAAGGTYTFGVNSDDGFTLAFPGRSFDAVTQANGAALQTYNGQVKGALQFYGGRGNNDSLASITFPATAQPTAVPFNLTFHQGGGGYGLEFFAAAGSKNGFDADFNLVGGPAISAAPKITETRNKGLGGLGVGTFSYTEIHGNGTGGNLPNGVANVTELLTAYQAGTGTRTNANPATVGFADPQGANTGGHPTSDFPGNTPADDDKFGAVATTTLTVDAAHAGKYTFVLYTDDGYAMDLRQGSTPGSGAFVPLSRADNADQRDQDGVNGNDTLFNDTGCCADRLAVFDLAAGTYTLETAFSEGGGGSGFYILGAQGDVSRTQADGSFNPQFVLLGDSSGGTVDYISQDGQVARAAGLQLGAVPEPTSLSILGLAGLGMLARRRKA